MSISFRDNSFHCSGSAEWARRFTLHLRDQNEHYFGVQETLYPGNRKSPDLRGSTFNLEVNGEQFRYAENFASAWSSFYYTTKRYASYINTFARGTYSFAVNGETSLSHETGVLDWHLFTGDAYEIYQQYYSQIGAPKRVLFWSCGPIVWRDENKNGSAEVLSDAANFSKLKIPITAMMIDRPYSNGALLWSKMDFSSSFSNPEKWIKILNDSFGLRLITWIAPATFSDTAFPGLLAGSFTYIDLSNPYAVNELASRLNRNQYKYGVKGHKMDRADELFPQHEKWYDNTAEPERKNKYVFLYAKTTDSILRTFLGEDQLNYARAAVQGTQPFLSGIWGGDPRSTWEGMAGNLANSVRASFMGFPNWGTDVGGYLGQSGQISDELYSRWLQWGAFNGIFEIKIDGPGGVGKDRAPWNCSQKVQDAFRKACETRMDWMPHIYSQLNSSSTNGPLMKPIAMLYPDDSTVYDIWDQYVFGNTLLIAPITANQASRNIYFPEGTWIDYNDGTEIKGEKTIAVKVSDSAMPMYIKSGSIQFRGRISESDESKYLNVYYYPAQDSTSTIFIDPRTNKSSYASCSRATDESISVAVPVLSYAGLVSVYSTRRPSRVYNGKKKVAFTYKDKYVTIERSVMRTTALRLTF